MSKQVPGFIQRAGGGSDRSGQIPLRRPSRTIWAQGALVANRKKRFRSSASRTLARSVWAGAGVLGRRHARAMGHEAVLGTALMIRRRQQPHRGRRPRPNALPKVNRSLPTEHRGRNPLLDRSKTGEFHDSRRSPRTGPKVALLVQSRVVSVAQGQTFRAQLSLATVIPVVIPIRKLITAESLNENQRPT